MREERWEMTSIDEKKIEVYQKCSKKNRFLLHRHPHRF